MVRTCRNLAGPGAHCPPLHPGREVVWSLAETSQGPCPRSKRDGVVPFYSSFLLRLCTLFSLTLSDPFIDFEHWHWEIWRI